MSSHAENSRTQGFAARAAAIAGAGIALTAFATATASAHVTVSSGRAIQGGYSTLVFQVPNESDTASTTKVMVAIPQATPISSVSYEPVPGWTTTVTRTKLPAPIATDDGNITEAVNTITWTASKSAAIAAGQFQTFAVSAGPLPKVDSISFETTQTYSDGTVVKWNETAVAGATEPEHPAPTLKLAAATEAAASTTATAVAQPAPSSASSNAWGFAALGVAVVALILGLAALVMGHKRRS